MSPRRQRNSDEHDLGAVMQSRISVCYEWFTFHIIAWTREIELWWGLAVTHFYTLERWERSAKVWLTWCAVTAAEHELLCCIPAGKTSRSSQGLRSKEADFYGWNLMAVWLNLRRSLACMVRQFCRWAQINQIWNCNLYIPPEWEMIVVNVVLRKSDVIWSTESATARTSKLIVETLTECMQKCVSLTCLTLSADIMDIVFFTET